MISSLVAIFVPPGASDGNLFNMTFHISVTYSFDHKRHGVTTLSWHNHAIIDTSCSRMLVIADYNGRIDLCLSEYTLLCLAIMTSSNGNNFCVTGPLCEEFTGHHKGQWHVALMFSFICAWTKRLRKQSRHRWFETPFRSLWCHCNAISRALYNNGLCCGVSKYWQMIYCYGRLQFRQFDYRQT